MSIRSWVAGKLGDTYTIEFEGEHGLRFERETLPTGLVYCAEADDGGNFTVSDLNTACGELPGVQFVVLVRRDADNEAYERSEDLGICLGEMGDLRSALQQDSNIATHRSSGHAYLLRRLENNQHVVSVRRRGKSAYEISRKASLQPLTIAATREYELTSDTIYELVEQNDSMDLHAIVSTNPACSGYAGEALDAGMRTGVRICSLNEFLDTLGDTWM